MNGRFHDALPGRNDELKFTVTAMDAIYLIGGCAENLIFAVAV
jgi:hypothetical protein